MRYKHWVIAFSLLLPFIIAFLYQVPKNNQLSQNIHLLPFINAFINGATSIVLLLGLYCIKSGKVDLHKKMMMLAMVLSGSFLCLYVIYHAMAESTKYGGMGELKYVYYFILLTHILTAAILAPFVLITFFRGYSNKFLKHKKIARITLPLWLYVSITGVLVYVMISPYYK